MYEKVVGEEHVTSSVEGYPDPGKVTSSIEEYPDHMIPSPPPPQPIHCSLTDHNFSLGNSSPPGAKTNSFQSSQCSYISNQVSFFSKIIRRICKLRIVDNDGTGNGNQNFTDG